MTEEADRPLVAVLDYGIGNLRSAQKALERVGADARLTADHGLIRDAAAVVLPGVGAFGACMEALNGSGLADEAVDRDRQRPSVPRHLRRHAAALRGLRGVARRARSGCAAGHAPASPGHGEASADAVERARRAPARRACSRRSTIRSGCTSSTPTRRRPTTTSWWPPATTAVRWRPRSSVGRSGPPSSTPRSPVATGLEILTGFVAAAAASAGVATAGEELR